MKTPTKVLLLLILPVYLAGCTFLTGGSESTLTPEENCANPLFPVKSGASWEYQGMDSLIGYYTVTYKIESLDAEGFQESVTYSTGASTVIDWTCEAGALSQLDGGNGPAGVMYSLGGTYGFTESSEQAGMTLPASVEAGYNWRQTMQVGGEVHLPSSTSGIADGAYLAEYTAIGMEMVDVPAGSFYAMRIEVQAAYDLVVSVQTMDIPMPFASSVVLWYVPGVGLVKAENTNEISGYEVIWLTRLSLP